jgi:hypothetical protein
MDRLLTVTSAISIVLLVTVLFSVRRAHIRAEYSMTWLFASFAMLVLSRSRGLLDYLRRAAGLPDTPLALFLIISAFFLIMFFRFSMIVSRLRDNNIALAQRLAILEYRLQSLNGHEK